MKSKALILLVIFLSNAITGFACALRMSVHDHEENTEHHHEHGKITKSRHEHQHDARQFVNSYHILNSTVISGNEACCQGAVYSFNTLAKVVPQTTPVILLAPLTFINSYLKFFLKPAIATHCLQLTLVEGRRRPPTYPIRVAIQSFQI